MTSIPEEQEVAGDADPGGTGVARALDRRMTADAPLYLSKARVERNEEEVQARRTLIVDATKKMTHAPEPTNDTIFDP
eukprot:9164886-Prorocentrum_lima.AAC.1